MYGADKILLEILQALPEDDRNSAVIYLPDDLPTNHGRLGDELDKLSVRNLVAPLPVLRRRYLRPQGIWPLVRHLWQTFHQFRDSKPDIVYCTTSAMVLCLPLARLAGVRKVVLHVQEIWSPKESLVLGLLARSATHILCISRASRESLSDSIRSRAQLLVNAHKESGTELSSRERDCGPIRFVVASRWNSWKGHKTLLDAWDSDEAPGVLSILGGPPPLGAGVDVPAMVTKLRHPSSVSLIGEVSDIEHYIDEADFLLLPSDSPEPFGLVLLESFARGRAVIASRGGGVTDIVDEGVDGMLYEIGNPMDLRSVLQSVDRLQAAELGANARRNYERAFSIEAYRVRFRELWIQIREDNRAANHAKG